VFVESPEQFDPRKILGPGRSAVKEVAMQKMEVIGSAGKASAIQQTGTPVFS